MVTAIAGAATRGAEPVAIGTEPAKEAALVERAVDRIEVELLADTGPIEAPAART